jgi:AcrR family transcriptional regulator
MVTTPSTPKRSYNGHIQATIASVTHQHILKATLDHCLITRPDQVTLEPIATRAGVAVQTILRHFSTKEGLLAAAAHHLYTEAQTHWEQITPGDVETALLTLAEQYERLIPWLDLLILQTDAAAAHQIWTTHIFSPSLPEPTTRHLRLAQIAAATDLSYWHTLRQTLNRAEAEQAWREVVMLIISYNP